MKKSTFTENKAEQTPTGGVLVGKRKGQTIIHNKGTLSGYLVGKTHAEGGIKAVNKSTGQPLEMQGGEVVITAPAVSDNTKREFEGKMMTNREILSTINEKGGGVAFAKDGMEIPKNVKRTGASYKYGGKTMTDHEIYKHITGGHLAEGMTLPQIAKMHKVSVKELQKQVDMGMKAESEHTSSKREQMKIVKDHLYENPKYYSLLKKAGLENGGGFEDIGLNLSKPIFENYWDGGFRMWIYDDPKAEEKLKSGEYDYFYPNFFEDYVEGIWHKTNLKKFKGAEHIVGYIEAKEDKTLKDLTTYGIEIGVMTTKPKYRRQGINSLMIKSIRDKYNLPQEAIDFYLPSEEGQLFIDSKKYNNGGRVHRGSLVRDAKKGNTPARDLNNYNDVLDLDADGMVGAETSLYADGGLIAPNGKTSNLTPEQYKLVRTTEFKAWFGDWENDPENASKVVDENGEPLVVYHGAYDYGFTIFNKKFRGNTTNAKSSKKGFFFYDKKKDAEMFSKMSASGGIYEVFLKIKYPNIKNYNSENVDADKELVKLINSFEFDGAIALNIKDGFDIGNQYIVFEPNQIKLADGSNTKFDNMNPDIRYADGGGVELKYQVTQKPDENGFYYIIYSESGKKVPSSKLPTNIGYGKINNEFLAKRKKYDNSLGLKEAKSISMLMNEKESYATGGDVKPYDANMEGDSADMMFAEGGGVGEGTKPEPKKERAKRTPKKTLTEIPDNISNFSGIIKDLPEKIKQLALQRQVDAGKTPNENLEVNEVPSEGGFRITETPEGDDFWLDILKGNFEPFKKIYGNYGEGTKPEPKKERAKRTTKTTASKTSKPIDLTNTKIWIGDNPELSRAVQEKAFELGWEWLTGDKTPQFLDGKSLFFWGDKLIAFSDGSKTYFDNDSKREIFASDLMSEAPKPKTTASQTSKPIDLFNKKIWVYNNPDLSRRVQELGFANGYINIDGTEVLEINETSIFFGETSQENKFMFVTKHTKDEFIKEPETEIFESDLFPTETTPIDLLNKKIWVNGNPDLSRRVQELAFANGFSTVDGKKIVNDTQLAGIFFGINKIMYIYDIPKGTFYLQEQVEVFESDLFPTATTTATTEIVEQPKPSKTEKPKRNFELERKYLTQRISDLAKELELKKPILSNEEVAFYQREINSFILKLRKLNDAEMSLKPIEERVRGVYDLKISSFENQYPETDMISINALKSQLTEKEYFNVRTPEFKSFFGDWETAYLTDSYAGVSKAINPITKEPQPVFHGTNVLFVDWKTYDTNNAHYFAVKREMSEFFATTWEERSDKAGVDSEILKKLNPNRGSFLLRCFIDVKNPIDFSRFGVDKYPIREYLTFLRVNYNIGDFDFWTNITSHSGFTQDTEVYAWQIIRLWQSFTKYIKVFTMYDGYIFYEYIPTKAYGGLENASLSYCAFESNQIKFTDAYEFNALSNDSRFDLGGIL